MNEFYRVTILQWHLVTAMLVQGQVIKREAGEGITTMQVGSKLSAVAAGHMM